MMLTRSGHIDMVMHGRAVVRLGIEALASLLCHKATANNWVGGGTFLINEVWVWPLFCSYMEIYLGQISL
jgi:hypothetical protein